MLIADPEVTVIIATISNRAVVLLRLLVVVANLTVTATVKAPYSRIFCFDMRQLHYDIEEVAVSNAFLLSLRQPSYSLYSLVWHWQCAKNTHGTLLARISVYVIYSHLI